MHTKQTCAQLQAARDLLASHRQDAHNSVLYGERVLRQKIPALPGFLKELQASRSAVVYYDSRIEKLDKQLEYFGVIAPSSEEEQRRFTYEYEIGKRVAVA